MADLAHAYVALGKGGLLKVGYTKRPEARLRLLNKEFKAKGDELVSFHPCEPTFGAWAVERRLIEHCREKYKLHSGFEWFAGCDAASVIAYAERTSLKYRDYKPAPPISAEESARLKAHWAKVHAERAARDVIRKAENARRSAAWQFKRRKAERVFASFVSFALGQQMGQPA